MSVVTGSMLRAKESHSTSLDQNQDNKPASYAFFLRLKLSPLVSLLTFYPNPFNTDSKKAIIS
jgi:predicted permease